ncbi:Protein TolB [Fervidicola ferrireducens]|uniref:Protein TolB n=1 Tax=Fervidicola ferrireducens TaxID=520764 RepID=A0A140LAI3_9FIRM|nr:PD40 domain-containing protein [Fervidicola ferrireducens]KXG77558.1 Protein TolB [Fervidicola ferrireducens]
MDKNFYRVTAYFLILVVVTGLAGCGNLATSESEVPVSKVLKPEGAVVELTMKGAEVKKATVTLDNGQVDYFEGGELFSPDFKWAAFSGTENGFGQGLWIFALDGSDAKLIEKIQGEDFESGNYRLWLLGWDSGGSLIYAVSGKEGLVFKKFDPENKKVKEVGCLPLEGGYWSRMIFNRYQNSVFVDLVSEIWKVDMAKETVSCLKKGLPSYDGLFYPRLSPVGDYFAYEKYEPDVPGVYVLDTKTGEERLLAGDNGVIRFSPIWSPDGLHLAYYVAAKDEEGNYDLIEGENYPYPIGNFLEIVNVKTGELLKIEIPGKKVGYARWNSDGTFLIFSAISEEKAEAAETTGPGTQDIENMRWDSLYIADLAGNVTEVAKSLKVPLVSYFDKEKRALYIADRDVLASKGELFYVSPGQGKEAVKIDGMKTWIINEETINESSIPEYQGKPLVAAYLQDGTFRIYALEGEKAEEVFSEKGSLWKYTVAGDFLVLSYTTKEGQKERLEFIKL